MVRSPQPVAVMLVPAQQNTASNHPDNTEERCDSACVVERLTPVWKILSKDIVAITGSS
jgi:hypothetical protein